MPRRAPKTGSVVRHGAGWRFRVRLASGKRHISSGYQTREECEATLKEFLKELDKVGLELRSARGVTFKGFGEAWLAQRMGRDWRSEQSRWALHISKAAFYDMPLQLLTADDIRGWVRAMVRKNAMTAAPGGLGAHKQTERTISAVTVKKVLGLVRQCLAAAQEDGHLAANPAEGVRVRPRERAHQEHSGELTYLTQAEIERLLAHPAVPPPARAAYAVAIYAGLRQGELVGLRWVDVLLGVAQPQLTVRRSHGGPTKTGRVRVVPLLEPARQALLAWQKVAPRDPSGVVWPSQRGGRRAKGDDFGWTDRSTPKGRTPGLRTKVGISRRVRFHDLRHTCASHLVMGTWGVIWSLSEVAGFLGHSRTSTTEIYAHLHPAHLHAKAAQTARGQGTAETAGLSEPGSSPGTVGSAGPQEATASGPSVADSSGEDSRLMGASGFEPLTFGFGGSEKVLVNYGVMADQVALWAQNYAKNGLQSVALAIIDLTAAQRPVPAILLQLLADAVLNAKGVKLAIRVRWGGPGSLRAAVELARMLLIDTPEADQDPKVKAGSAAR